MIGFNGGLIGKNRTYASTGANSGIWSLDERTNALMEPWNPSMISTSLWLDAADQTTLFTTDAGSTQSTNGAEVGRWKDKSGNGRHATQTASANRPSCLTNALNGRQGVQFSSNARA